MKMSIPCLNCKDGVEIVAVMDITSELEFSTGDVGLGSVGVTLGGSIVDRLVDDVNDSSPGVR